MSHRRLPLATVVLLFAAGLADAATPAAPPPPAEYDATVRFRIRAGRDLRLTQYDMLERYLASVGFRETPNAAGDFVDPTDPEVDRITGTIASSQAAKLILAPFVTNVLLAPAGYKLPADPEAPVKLRLLLSGGLPLERQRMLAEQASATLARIGFREAIGYDHRGFTLLRGTIPAKRVGALLADLREQPAGWLASETPRAEVPSPLRERPPVRLVELIPEPADFPPARAEPPAPPAPPADQAFVGKIGDDVAELFRAEPRAHRLEIVLAATPPDDLDRSWRGPLFAAAPGIEIEGRLGPLVTAVVPSADQAVGLASLPEVTALRTPRTGEARSQPTPPPPPPDVSAMRATRLDQLHKLGRRGDGVRVVLIDSDFSGFKKFVGKGLPARTRLIDLTAETSRDLLTAPSSAPEGPIGHGTHCALALALAAPDADLTLVRIDPTAPHQVLTVTRYVRGESFATEAMRSRSREQADDQQRLALRRGALAAQRKQIFAEFSDEPDAIKRRDENTAAFAELEKQERALRERINRFDDLSLALGSLRGTQVVASSLVWNEGHPTDGGSYLSRSLINLIGRSSSIIAENVQKKKPLPVWAQSAGNTRGQSWAGPFRDGDGNGVMEFVTPEVVPPAERWTRELNFLAFQKLAGAGPSPDLPAGTKLRVSIQWREPVDPALYDPTDVFYRQPLAPLSLVVLRQRDPKGSQVPADDLEVIARSHGMPQRLYKDSRQSAWEQTVELAVPEGGGRLALRVEGRVPPGIRPAAAPAVPAVEQAWELRTRVFLEVTDPAVRQSARVVFLDFATEPGGVGAPGDAWTVLTVGAAHLSDRPEPASALGGGPNVTLLNKPDVLVYDHLPLPADVKGPASGTGLANAFGAGMVASLVSAGAPQADLLKFLGIERGNLFILPEKLFAK